MDLKFNRIKVSRSSTSKLSVLKKRTGLTPNLLCRLGLCLSLEVRGLPALDFDEDGAEFNRYTLLGELDDVFVALFIERMRNDNLSSDVEVMTHFKAHINRGVTMLHSRFKMITDLEHLLKQERKTP